MDAYLQTCGQHINETQGNQHKSDTPLPVHADDATISIAVESVDTAEPSSAADVLLAA